jgi:hypothetical protein
MSLTRDNGEERSGWLDFLHDENLNLKMVKHFLELPKALTRPSAAGRHSRKY